MARPTRTVSLTRRAETDLEGIYDYTAEAWSARRAKRYTDSLYFAFLDLASGLLVGRDTGFDDGHERISVGSHAVFYLATDQNITVVRVLHQAMDFPRRLES